MDFVTCICRRSRYYNDSYNFIVFGGTKNWMGSHKYNIGAVSTDFLWIFDCFSTVLWTA